MATQKGGLNYLLKSVLNNYVADKNLNLKVLATDYPSEHPQFPSASTSCSD